MTVTGEKGPLQCHPVSERATSATPPAPVHGLESVPFGTVDVLNGVQDIPLTVSLRAPPHSPTRKTRFAFPPPPAQKTQRAPSADIVGTDAGHTHSDPLGEIAQTESSCGFTDPHEQRRDKDGILSRIDRVRGVVEMTARLLILDGGDFADYGAALELAHAELQRIREEIDATFPADR